MRRRWQEDARAWRALAACVVVIVLAAGSRASLAAFLLPIERDLGLDRAVLSTAGALTVLMYGLAQPVVGAPAARFGARRVMLAGVTLTALGGFGVAVLGSYTPAVLTVALVALVGGVAQLGIPGTRALPAE